ncbi:MAG TPA: urease accessory UreF family protein [Vicinamibacterales bacterium]|nr:urease accessory UreF family protein [Vicinamibacterales bacterium]
MITHSQTGTEATETGRNTLLTLLHLCDSLFPIGGFGYSDGLESATASAAIAGVEDLEAWVDACLVESIGRLEAPCVWLAWSAFQGEEWPTIIRLDQEITALRPSSAIRRGSRAMGWRLVTTWQALYPAASLSTLIALARSGVVGPNLPVAFASVCASSGVGRRAVVEAFAYNRLAATISSAMRLMAIGQTDAHAMLARTLARVPALVDEVEARCAAPSAFAPAMDIAAMTQQYLHSRLFRS